MKRVFNKSVLVTLIVITMGAVFLTQCARRDGTNTVLENAASKVYVAPGEYDEFYAFMDLDGDGAITSQEAGQTMIFDSSAGNPDGLTNYNRDLQTASGVDCHQLAISGAHGRIQRIPCAKRFAAALASPVTGSDCVGAVHTGLNRPLGFVE